MHRKRIIKLIFTIGGAAIGISYFPMMWYLLNIPSGNLINNPITDILLGAIIFYIISLFVSNYILKAVDQAEKNLVNLRPDELLSSTLGLIIGLVLALLISTIFFRFHSVFLSIMIPIIIMIGLGYLGLRLGFAQSKRMGKLFTFKNKASANLKNSKFDEQLIDHPTDLNYHHYKILDTNILIDGRIYDIVKTGFIEGTLLVPNFVLYELQYIADSSDSVKRVRGRRGLDILNKLQNENLIPIEIYEKDYENIDEVDSKLIQLAKDLDGVIITNDYNLNKVVQFQHVDVFNINALANSLKQKVLPGQTLNVMVVKNGTERQQGVAYLDDGTMVVVENGKYYLNEHLDVIVTSAIQTDAGKMIFAKPEHADKGIENKKDNHK